MHIRKSYVRANKLDVTKQTSVSHSSTEAEIISLDGLSHGWDSQLSIFGIW